MKLNELLKRLDDVEIPKKHSILSTIYNIYGLLYNDSVLIKYGDEFYVYRNKGSPRILIDLDDRKVHIGIPMIYFHGLEFKFAIFSYNREFSPRKLNTILVNTPFIKEEAEPIDVVNEFGYVPFGLRRKIVFEYDVTKRAEEIFNKYLRPDSVDVKTKIINVKSHRREFKIVTLKYGNEEIKLTPLARRLLGLNSPSAGRLLGLHFHDLITYSGVCDKLYSSSTCTSAVRNNIFKTLYRLQNHGLIDKRYVVTTVKGFVVYKAWYNTS